MDLARLDQRTTIFILHLMDNADEYGDMDEAIASTSATLQDVFDYKKIFKGADKIWKEKGKAGLDDIEKYIKDNVEGYIEADNEGDTGYEGEPEPVDEDPRDYLERDYASGPHMNSFKPEMSFKQFYLSERYDHDAIVRRQAADQAALPAGIHAANKAKRNAARSQKAADRAAGIMPWDSKLKYHAGKTDEDETDEEMPETVFGGPGEAEAANKGKKMRKGIPEQPNVAGAPEIINSPGPNYTNQPSLGVKKNRTYANKNLVRGRYKTDV